MTGGRAVRWMTASTASLLLHAGIALSLARLEPPERESLAEPVEIVFTPAPIVAGTQGPLPRHSVSTDFSARPDSLEGTGRRIESGARNPDLPIHGQFEPRHLAAPQQSTIALPLDSGTGASPARSEPREVASAALDTPTPTLPTTAPAIPTIVAPRRNEPDVLAPPALRPPSLPGQGLAVLIPERPAPVPVAPPSTALGGTLAPRPPQTPGFSVVPTPETVPRAPAPMSAVREVSITDPPPSVPATAEAPVGGIAARVPIVMPSPTSARSEASPLNREGARFVTPQQRPGAIATRPIMPGRPTDLGQQPRELQSTPTPPRPIASLPNQPPAQSQQAALVPPDLPNDGAAADAPAEAPAFLPADPESPPESHSTTVPGITGTNGLESFAATGGPEASPDANERDRTLHAALIRFLADQPPVECRVALPTIGSDARLGVEIFAADAPGLEAMRNGILEATGTVPSIVSRIVDPLQCAAVDFARMMPEYPRYSLNLELERREIASGEALSGSITNLGSRILHLLVIDDDGRAQALDTFLTFRRDGVQFTIPMTFQGEQTETWQLLLAISSAEPLSSLQSLGGPVPVQQLLGSVAIELVQKGVDIDLALLAFSVRDPVQR